jgi:hypothetical protein
MKGDVNRLTVEPRVELSVEERMVLKAFLARTSASGWALRARW